MRDSDADIAIDVLNKLIDQELKAASAGMRDGNRILEECASTRYHAYTFARDEIRKALADAVEERDARNPFQCQRDELVTQDMHTCDLCGRWCPSPRVPRVPVLRGPVQGGVRCVRRLHVEAWIQAGRDGAARGVSAV